MNEKLVVVKSRDPEAIIADLERWNLPGGKVCIWKQMEEIYDDHWEASCGGAFQFMDGGPGENGVRFCPYCGRVLQEAT